ncbi:ABC transporter substrate-binding protein [Bradyrhizobium betae]|uniref:ABC transporter substrate-binding protein n=1 Tax=Bradyrhizobium betae TaxID=244734 RepID=A0A5P6PA65_9BRAD|nr:ABC transporter substrate-binding protein [Bradyrhizobium betae]MCS3726837.1 branched-chain amino acid transport system substrate-binding protein [Bradyrhizobium betae]QFI75220.1 ABC transporter substrate-binding protein [Bradyrhizobium betae]
MSQSKHHASRRTVLGLLAAAPAVLSSRTAFADEPIKIGGIFPLTGGNSVFGNQNFQGVEVAIDLMNGRGGIKGRKIQLFKGDGNSPQAAISETNRLASREGVRIFTGSSTSAVGMVASQEAERNGAFYWEGMAVANNYTERDFKNVFRMGLSAAGLGQPAPIYTAEVIAPMLKIEPKNLKVAVIAEDSAFGVDVSKAAIEQAEKLGIKIGLRELYSAKTTDLSPLVLKLRSFDPDVIIATQFINDAILLQRQMKEMNYSPRAFVGTSAGHSTLSLAEAIGKDVNGIFSSSFPLEANVNSLSAEARADRDEFVKRYEAKFKVAPAVQESLGFVVGIALARDILAKAASDNAADLREASLKADVPVGSYINGWGLKFDDKGQNQRAVGSVIQWQGEKMISVYPQANKVRDAIMVPLPAWNAR